MIFAALASTSFSALATDSWYLGPFTGQQFGNKPTAFWGLISTTNPGSFASEGTLGLVLTLNQDGKASSNITLSDLGLAYGNYSLEQGYIPITGSPTAINLLTATVGAEVTGAKKLTLQGVSILDGNINLAATGGESTASSSFGSNPTVTVLTVGATEQGSVAVNNSGAVNVGFSATGASITGLNVQANGTNLGNWTSTAAESYSVASTATGTNNTTATAVTVSGTGVWKNNFTASAMGGVANSASTASVNATALYIPQTTTEGASNVTLSGPTTTLKATSTQGVAYGLLVGSDNGSNTGNQSVAISSTDLVIEASANAGGATGLGDQVQAAGILFGGGDGASLAITSENITITTTSEGTDSVASVATGIQGVAGTTAPMVIGGENTKTITINANIKPTMAEYRDLAVAIAPRGNVTIGGENTTTTINIGLTGTIPDGWEGEISAIQALSTENSPTNVTLNGTGSITVPVAPEGLGEKASFNAIVVSSLAANQPSGLSVKGTWETDGNVAVGSQTATNGASSLAIDGGSLTVGGDLNVQKNDTGNNVYVGGVLEVTDTVNNAGTVVVGTTDGKDTTTGSFTAGNVANSNAFTVNSGSIASVTGADPQDGAAFNNTGTLNVNGSLSVADTLQNSGTTGSVVVGSGGTLTLNDVVNTSTNTSKAFETEAGSTLVITGTVNADEGKGSGTISGGKALTVNGDLVTNTSNFFEDADDTTSSGVFTLGGNSSLTLEGSLTQAQIDALELGAGNKLTVTDGVVFAPGTSLYTQQQYLQTNGIGDLSFAYTQKNTIDPDEKGAKAKVNLVVGTAPNQSSGTVIDKTYIAQLAGTGTTAQYDVWSKGMGVGSINLGSGDQIYVGGTGGNLQVGGLNGNLVTNDANVATITVDQAGVLTIGGTGGSNATAPNLTIDVIRGAQMNVQGDVYLNKSLSYEIGTINLGNAYNGVASPAVGGTAGKLTIDNASLTVGTLNVYVQTAAGKTATGGSTIFVKNGTLTTTNTLQINGLSALSAGGNPNQITLENGSLVSTAGLTASYTNIGGTGDNTLSIGSAELNLTNSPVTFTEGTTTITAGTTTLTSSPISIDQGSITLGETTLTKGSNLTVADGSITLGNTTLTDSNITVTSGDLTIGTLAASASASNKDGVEINVDNGNLTTGNAQIGSQVTITVGETSTVSMGDVQLAGDLNVTGAAEGTTLAPVTLQSLTFGQNTGSFTAGSGLAVQVGPGDIATATKALTGVYGSSLTNVLSVGSTITLNEANSFTIGTAPAAAAATPAAASEAAPAAATPATPGTGLTLIGTTGVYADMLTLKGQPMFHGEGEDLNVTIPSETVFLIANPIGNGTFYVVDDGFDTSGLDLTGNEIRSTNPLYDINWVVQDPAVDAADVNQTGFTVKINPDKVRNDLKSIAPNTVINAADIPYGTNYGADTILNAIAGVDGTEASYAQAAWVINTLAMRGAAAHAHEIGISAASMVIDSVWDHTSKLAAAPHEQAKADLWITLDWNHSRANDYKAAGLDNGYKLDLYGATFGADYDFANGLAAGLAVSVGGGEAKSKGYNAGQKTDVTYWGINLYGTYTSPIVNVIGNVGYIGIKNKTKIGSDKGRPDANIWTIGVKAEKDFAINEQFTVTPHVGIRYLSVDVDDFNLQGFHYGTDRANLVQFPIGVAFAANLKTANGASVKPFLDLSFVPTAGDKKVDNTFGITGGSARDVIDTTIASTSMFQGKIGVNASYGAHNFGLNFAIGGGNKGRLDTGLQAKYRFVF